ncbi:nicotinate-nucleotide adenylyltransferase [Sinobacterium caligoides]|uniref:Probable nicotinate-nucleotide adenylyltransferase n=1 Tax=Sinobacterium caligoides TaxID=933926 RepID=A0A3N2DNJ3_9GAMM|nr:nicotinate-nucleotide adenylyltransferase [Sinobacterium caligoides]ROS01373.1 nicotinate-nucleotide adenylyltransferase [Sinobacterium caligoides]
MVTLGDKPLVTGRHAVFGGTFNPVHNGHLQTALELQRLLAVDSLGLMPSARPPHRARPQASDAQRLAMLELAIASYPQLRLDCREFARSGLSYTVETLSEMRREQGDDVWLAFCAGMDSLLNLSSWHRWQALTDYAHLVICARPGWSMSELPDGELRDWLATRLETDVKGLDGSVAGKVLVVELTPYDISSSQIRQAIATGESTRDWLLPSVTRYIQQHGLYLEAG